MKQHCNSSVKCRNVTQNHKSLGCHQRECISQNDSLFWDNVHIRTCLAKCKTSTLAVALAAKHLEVTLISITHKLNEHVLFCFARLTLAYHHHHGYAYFIEPAQLSRRRISCYLQRESASMWWHIARIDQSKSKNEKHDRSTGKRIYREVMFHSKILTQCLMQFYGCLKKYFGQEIYQPIFTKK